MRAAGSRGDPQSTRSPGGRPGSQSQLGPRQASRLSARSVQSGYSIASRRSVAVYVKAAKVVMPGLSWTWALSAALLLTAGSLDGTAVISEHWVVGDVTSPTRGTIEVGPLRRCFTPQYQDSLCTNLSPADSPNSLWEIGTGALIAGTMLLAVAIFLTSMAVAIPWVATYAMYATALSALGKIVGLVLIMEGYTGLADRCPDGTPLYTHCGLTCHGTGSAGWRICDPFSTGWAFDYGIVVLVLSILAAGALHMVDKTPPVPQPKSGVSRQSLLDPLFVANGSPRPGTSSSGTQALRQASLRPPGQRQHPGSPSPQQQSGRGRGHPYPAEPVRDDMKLWQQSEMDGVALPAVSTVAEDDEVTEVDESTTGGGGDPVTWPPGSPVSLTPKNRLSERHSTTI